MKTKTNPSRNGTSLLTTFYEGFSTYTIVLPMPYAISFHLEGLLAALSLLGQNELARNKLDEQEGKKAEIQEWLRRAIVLYEEYLDRSGR